MPKFARLILTGLAAGAAASPAAAATIVACGGGSNCLAGTVNVNLVTAENTALGAGNIGIGGPAVTFTTTELGGLDLTSGAATVTAGDEGTLTNLTFNVLTGFTKAEFNLEPLTGQRGGPVQFGVSFTSNLGFTGTTSFAAPSGNQRFALFAGAGETFTSVTLTSAEGLGTFKQLRIGTAIAGVPEPSTWALFILGFGVLGGAMRRRTAKSAAAHASLV